VVVGHAAATVAAVVPEQVTAGWMANVLGGEVAAIEQQRIGDGLVGMNLRVRLVDAAPGLPGSVVVKLPSLDPTSKATGITLRNYEREVRFYQSVAATVDIRVPRCFFAEWHPDSGDFVLVLEDMAPAEVGDQLVGCDVATAHAAVAELATLHGPRWNDPELADVEWLSRTTPDTLMQLQMIWTMTLPGFRDTYSTYLDADGRDLVERFGTRLGEWVANRDAPLAVTHGDYRLDNLLFGDGRGAPRVTVVDWQSPGHGTPFADLAYFCGAGLVPDDRRCYERALLDTYAAGLDAYGVAVDATELWHQYRREAFAGVVMAVVASQLVGRSERSEAMFAAMATRHVCHALDLDSFDVI
jgi:hypothetical protein